MVLIILLVAGFLQYKENSIVKTILIVIVVSVVCFVPMIRSLYHVVYKFHLGSGGTMCGVGGGCDRPVVWLATSNHMMCERNVNSDGAFPNGWKAWTLEDYDP